MNLTPARCIAHASVTIPLTTGVAWCRRGRHYIWATIPPITPVLPRAA